MISNNSIKRFIEIYREYFGDESTEEQIALVAQTLIEIYKLVYTKDSE